MDMKMRSLQQHACTGSKQASAVLHAPVVSMNTLGGQPKSASKARNMEPKLWPSMVKRGYIEASARIRAMQAQNNSWC